MGYVLGIDLGTSRTAAAVFRDHRADLVPLSDHSATMPSMVFVRDDSSLLVGEAARRRGLDDPERLAREFKRRFGDETPFVLGESSFTPEQLTAALLRHVVSDVARREGGAPDRVVVAHPANWGSYRRELLRREVNAAGLPTAQLVSEPDAAAVHYASGERMTAGDVIAVYDLGGGTFDAAVLRRTETGFIQVGEPKGVERLGGIDFDEAVFQHVVSTSGLDVSTLTEADRPALMRLRDECVAAKEALSDDLEATVQVMVGNAPTRVRVTRGEFESMIRPWIRESVLCLKTAILDSGLKPDDLSGVLMIGGSSRIPLAAKMVLEELQRPILLTSNPKEAVALGAARIGAGPTPLTVEQPAAIHAPPAFLPAPAPPVPTPTAPTVPTQAAAPIPTPAPTPAPVPAAPLTSPAFAPTPARVSMLRDPQRRNAVIAVGAAVAILLGVGAALITKPDSTSAPVSTTTSTTSTSTSTSTTTTTPTPTTLGVFEIGSFASSTVNRAVGTTTEASFTVSWVNAPNAFTFVDVVSVARVSGSLNLLGTGDGSLGDSTTGQFGGEVKVFATCNAAGSEDFTITLAGPDETSQSSKDLTVTLICE